MTGSEIYRRQFLSSASVAGLSGVAGCSNDETTPSENDDNSNNEHSNTEESAGEESHENEGDEDNDKNVFYVAPDGDDENAGSESNPLRTIREGLTRAHPGDTVQLEPGEYREEIRTIRSGEPDAPITITGPEDAVWRPWEDAFALLEIAHSHIHVTGITMNGLKNEDGAYQYREAYVTNLVQISPLATHRLDDLEPVDYLEGVVFEPANIGHCLGNMIFVTRLREASIGGFKVIGPAGMIFHPDIENPIEAHAGEIVYVGTTLDDLDETYPWDSLDRSQNIRIHNINNSEGYHHSQFIDLKIGTENITIENCTDRNAGSTTDGVDAAVIELKGNNHTVRWNDIGDCRWGFIFGAWVPDGHDHHADGENWARHNEVYGNYIHGFSEDAFMFYKERTAGGSGPVSPEDQAVMCGNEIEGDDDKYEYATGECGDEVPESDGTGAAN